MAQMFTQRSSLHLILFVLLCASPMSRAQTSSKKYSADGCADADFIGKIWYEDCFESGGNYIAITCSGTAWSAALHTDAVCATTGTEVFEGEVGECTLDPDGLLYEIATCDDTPPYAVEVSSFTTEDCSGTAVAVHNFMWETECVDSGDATASSKEYVLSDGNFTLNAYPSTDCSGTAHSDQFFTVPCGDTCTEIESGAYVKVTCPASSSVISGAPRVAPVPQLVGAPVLCMALLMKLLV